MGSWGEFLGFQGERSQKEAEGRPRTLTAPRGTCFCPTLWLLRLSLGPSCSHPVSC